MRRGETAAHESRRRAGETADKLSVQQPYSGGHKQSERVWRVYGARDKLTFASSAE